MARPRKPPRLAQDPATRHWSILWHDGKRDRRSRTGTGSRQEAEAAFSEFLIEHGRPADVGLREPHEILIGDVLTAYAEERAADRASASTLGLYIGYLATYFGTAPVSAINPTLIKGYCAARRARRVGAEDPGVRARAKLPGDSTLRKELSVLVAALNHAAEQHRLTRVPPIELPAAAPRKDRWCTPEEIAQLLAATAGAQGSTPKKVAAGIKLRRHLRLFILLALATGGRRAALTRMQWAQVDLERGMIDLNPPGRAQTAKGRPRVPMDPWVIKELRAAKEEAKTEFVIECRGKAVQSIARAFHALATRAGLPDVSPHVLRHTVGTWAAQAGKPIGHIAWLLGHSETQTTEIYKHQHPDHIRDTVGAITDRMGWRETGGKPPKKTRIRAGLAGNSVSRDTKNPA